MRYLFATALLALAVLALPAFAQTCDQQLNMTIKQGDTVIVDTTTVYHGLDVKEVEGLNKARLAHTINVASQQQDKKGPYTVLLSSTGTCPAAPEMELRGVTRQGINRIVMASAKTESDLNFKKWH